MPLWGRLAAAVVCLTGAAAAVIVVAGLSVVRANLMRQTDLQLEATASRFDGHAVLSGLNPGPMSGGAGTGGLRVEVLGAAGQWLMPDGWGTATASPAVPASPGWTSAHAGRPVTLPARGGGPVWRVVVEPIRYRAQRILYAYGANDFTLVLNSRSGTGLPAVLVVGADLAGAGRAIRRLAVEGFAVSLAVILVAAGLTAAAARAGIGRSVTAMMNRTGAARPTESGRPPGARPGAPGAARAGPGAASPEAAAHGREEQLRGILIGSVQDLREPLNVIGGFAEYYRQRGRLEDGDHDPMMGRVEDEAARMGATIDALEQAATPYGTAPRPDGEA